MPGESKVSFAEMSASAQEIEHRLGRVIVAGPCLSTQEEIVTASDAALHHSDVERMQGLLGSFSVVMEQDEQTVVATDISSQNTVFWKIIDGSPRLSLTASTLGSEPNPTYLAAMIGCEVEPLISGMTAYQDVHSIEGGQVVRFRHGQQHILSNGIIVPDHALSLGDAAIDLREELVRAIRARIELGLITTSDGSGGLDSTTIALLAAEEYRGVLQAVILDSPFTMTADVPYARESVAGNPRIHLNEIKIDETALPFYGLEHVDLHDQPDPVSSINARIRTKLRFLEDVGSQIHLTGDGGDAILDSPPNYLTDLARLGLHEELRRNAIAWGRLRYLAPRDLEREAWRNVPRTITHDLYRLIRKLHNPELQTSRLTWFEWPSQGLTVLSKYARQLLAERAEEAADTIRIPEEVGAADYVSLSGLRQGGRIHSHLQSIAAAKGIATHAPLMDTQVVKACMQLPAYLRANRREQFKELIGEAFPELPDVLRARSSKGNYAPEAYKGLRRNKKAVENLLLRNSRLEEMGIMDVRGVREVIQRQTGGLKTELQVLDRLVATEIWLRRKGW